MTRTNFNSAALALMVLVATAAPALARGNDLIIKDGMGEEVTIRNGFFGRKTKVVKDRFGNKYETKSGLFGSKDTEVNVLGNSFKKKTGWFGRSNIEGSTIAGDKITTKTGLFGRKTTTIDASGISQLVKGLLKDQSPAKPNVMNNLNDLPDTLPGLSDQGAVSGSDYNNAPSSSNF